MKPITDIEFLKEDYDKFKNALGKKQKSIFPKDTNTENVFKKTHKLVYLLALILKKLKVVYALEHQTIYLNEILSDSFSFVSLAFLGYEIPSLIIKRRICENFYNHIYYFQHPIEHAYLNFGKNEYTPIKELKIYVETHPIFIDHIDTNIKEFNQDIFNVYHQLCKVVHAKGKDSMNLAKDLKNLRPEFDVKNHFEGFNFLLIWMIYIIYKFHRDIDYTTIDKKIFSSAMLKKYRVTLHN